MIRIFPTDVLYFRNNFLNDLSVYKLDLLGKLVKDLVCMIWIVDMYMLSRK
jgi:hypothetical protein